LSELPELSREAACRIGPLVGIGGKSGDTVCGLSAVRRTRALAYVFVAAGLAAGTRRELSRLCRQGTRVFRVEGLEELTRAVGRAGVSVVGVKRGPLAEGIGRRLGESGRGE